MYFEPDATVAGTVAEIDKIEQIVLSNVDVENRELLKMKLELSKHQSNALMLKEYFIPDQAAYKYANTAKHLIDIISERILSNTQHLQSIKDYFVKKHTAFEWKEIMNEIKNNKN